MSKRKEKARRFRDRQKQKVRRVAEQRQREHYALIADVHPDRILYVPEDIGKNVHWFKMETGAGRVIHEPKELLANYEGYFYYGHCLRHYLTCGEFDLVFTGHEPTGIYHETWCRQKLGDFAPYLEKTAPPRLVYRLLNPFQVKREREKLTGRFSKDDPIDLWAMDNLLRQGQGYPAQLPDPDTALLRQYVFFARQATQQLKAVRNDIIRQFDRIWPGAVVNVKRFQRAHPDLPLPAPIVRSKPFERRSFRLLLEHCPNPYRVRELGEQGIIDLFHAHQQRCGPKTARHILHCAQRALLNPLPLVQVYIAGLQQLLTDEGHWLERRQWAQERLIPLVHRTPAHHLLSINGLSPLFAARYLNLVGYPPRFDWADQVWAYVGFDTVKNTSGDSNPGRPFKISRQGEGYHRDTLTWMANLVAAHHPEFGQEFIAAEARGMGVWGAAIHVAHKLNRVCFRLLLEARPYRDHTPPDDFARWHAYWIAHRQHRRNPQKYPHPGLWKPTQEHGRR